MLMDQRPNTEPTAATGGGGPSSGLGGLAGLGHGNGAPSLQDSLVLLALQVRFLQHSLFIQNQMIYFQIFKK